MACDTYRNIYNELETFRVAYIEKYKIECHHIYVKKKSVYKKQIKKK